MSADWEAKRRGLRDRFAAMAAGELSRAAAMLEGADRVQAEAVAELRAIFHKLGGSAGSCGFRELSPLCFDAELACRALLERGADLDADDADGLRRTVARLAAELETAAVREQEA
jgi:HPt (histidine-containing phosphotransfer) domain-containing protein